MFIRSTLIISVVLMLKSACCPAQDGASRDYYTHYTQANFRSEQLFNEVLDLKDPDLKRIQAVIFFLTNEIRVKNHLLPLAYSKKLEKTAEMHAESMVKENFFSHFNPHQADMKTPNDRAKINQIANPFLAENIIEGYGLQYISNKKVYLLGKGKFSYKPEGELLMPHTYLSIGESLLLGWMNSKEHRKNILSREAVQLGCGIFFYANAAFNDMPSCKAVQDFQWYQVTK